MRWRGAVLIGVVVGLVSLLPSAPLAAQDRGTLEEAEQLARMGRSEEARAALLAWWSAERDQASRRDVQRALWLRGTLTVDPSQAAMDFRRLVIEYPGGPFSDRALFRLAQGAHASGDGEAASAYVAALERDYPASPLRREAEDWLAAAGPAPEPPAAALPAVEEAGGDSVAAGDTLQLGASAPSAPSPRPSARGVPRFSVQLGAFASTERARALYRSALDRGLDARLVRVEGTRLVHVRVGLFDSAASAGELLRRVGGMGFVAALVRDAHKEEHIQR